jgi:hypothetical protein
MTTVEPWIIVWGRSPYGSIWHAAEAQRRVIGFGVKPQALCGRYLRWAMVREPHAMMNQQRKCPTCVVWTVSLKAGD